MSDAKLRDLERRFRESGAPSDEALLLRERLRAAPGDAGALWRMLHVLPAEDPARASYASALLEVTRPFVAGDAIPREGEGFFPRRLGDVLLDSFGEWEQGASFRAWRGGEAASAWIVSGSGGSHRPDPARVEADLDRCAQLRAPQLVPLADWDLGPPAHLVGGETPARARSLLRVAHPVREHALQLLAQVCRAVSVGHREGLAHGDVSAASVLVDDAGDAWLRPFGQAYLIERLRVDGGAPGGVISGGIHLRCPEELQGGRLTPRSDVFQLGVLAYWLLTERQPFLGATAMETLRLVLSEEPPFLGERALDDLFEVALARDPADRFPDVMELADALGELEGWPG